MMDYYGFWQGFILLFGVLPVVVGAIIGVLWAAALAPIAPALGSRIATRAARCAYPADRSAP